MHTLISHLQMTAFMLRSGSHGHETPAPSPDHTGNRSGGGLFDMFFHSAVRGAGWSMGSRIMHALPIGVVILLAVVAAIVYFMRRRKAK